MLDELRWTNERRCCNATGGTVLFQEKPAEGFVVSDYPCRPTKFPNSDHRDGSGVRCGIWQWQELEEIITPSAGLVWSPVGRTATRMGSAQPTRLPAGSGLPSGTVSSPRSITRPLICPRCETSSFFLLMVNPSFIRRQSIWRAAFSACHLAWDTALKGRTRKAAMLTSEPNQRGLLRAAGEQEDFRPLFAHQKTGPSAGLGSPRTHLLGTCSPADRRICVSSLGRSRGGRSKARFPPARLLHAGGR